MAIVGCQDFEVSKQRNFPQIPRFCYRKAFQPINGTRITTDKGWGCCYRSCQGLLCQFVLRLEVHFPEKYHEAFGDRCPLSLFADEPTAPFGIHNLVEATSHHGLKKGEWAKPSVLAASIQDILKEHGIGCIVAQDFSIVKSADIDDLFPAMFLIPGLFGLDKFDQENFSDLITMCFCEKDTSLGVVSGKGNSAYFLFGVDPGSMTFMYFDPHRTDAAVVDDTGFLSFYYLPWKQLKLCDLNPSILIGFVVSNHVHFDNLLHKLTTCRGSPISVTSSADMEAIEAQVLDVDDLDL